MCWQSCSRDKETVSCPCPQIYIRMLELMLFGSFIGMAKCLWIIHQTLHSYWSPPPPRTKTWPMPPSLHPTMIPITSRKRDLITFLSQPVTHLPRLRLEHIEDHLLVHPNPVKSAQMVVVFLNHSSSAWNLYTLSQYTTLHLIRAEGICSMLWVSHRGRRGKRCWTILLWFTGLGRRQIWWLFLSNEHGMFWS